MKKKIILSAALALCGIVGLKAQYSITDYSSTTAGITENYPVDIEYNSFNAKYSSLHSNSTGMSVANYSATSGTYINSLNLSRSGMAYSPVKILHFGTYTYVLFNYSISSTQRFGICKYNNATNALVWCNGLTNWNNTIDQYAEDMALDAAGNVFVLGGYTSGAGDQDICITAITSGGILSWNNRYANTVYDEAPMNIDYDLGSTQLIIGGTAVAVSNFMDRNVLVWRVDATGVLQASTLINYTGSPSWRISTACAKRNGKSVYVTATSFVGADGAGPMFVARINATTLALVTYKVYYSNPTYFNPEFNFVNNKTDLELTGSASFVNTGTPGLVNTMFDLTCTYVSESRYTGLPSFAFGGEIYNGYNVTNNELGTIAKDASNPGYFYFIKSRYDGYTTCDVNPSYSLAPYTIQNNVYSTTPSGYDATFPIIGHFSIAPMTHAGTNVCYYNPCSNCGLSTFGGTEKSLTTEEVLPALTLYPNPATDKITVSVTEDRMINTIEVMDINGRLIKAESTSYNNVDFVVDVHDLKQGMYLMKVTYVDGSVDTKRFVKE